MSELCRCSWDRVWVMAAPEFLNLLCYLKDKRAKEEADAEKWRKEH